MTSSHDDTTLPQANHHQPSAEMPDEEMQPHKTTHLSLKKLWSLLILGLVAIVAGMIFTIEMYRSLRTITENNKQLDTQVKQLTSRLDHATQITAQAMQHLRNDIEHLNQTLAKFKQPQEKTSDDWLLLSARYYLELANAHSMAMSNPELTIMLLQEAREQLSTLDDSALEPTRMAIENDIASQQALMSTDTRSVLQKIQAVKSSLNQLSFSKPTAMVKNPSDTISPSWQTQLKDAMEQLQKIVVIQHHEDAFQPTSLLSHDPMAKHAAQLALEEAEIALLQRNSDLYQWSINRAIQIIQNSFDQHQDDTQSALKELSALKDISISSAHTSSITALSIINELLHNKHLDADTGANA